jgi:WD40 repeat protein
MMLNAVIVVFGMAPHCPVIKEYIGHTNRVEVIRVISYNHTRNNVAIEAGTSFLSCSYDKKVMLWDANSSTKYVRQFDILSPVFALEVLANKLFLAGTWDNWIGLFSVEGGNTAIRKFTGHNSYVKCLKDLGDGTFLSGKQFLYI